MFSRVYLVWLPCFPAFIQATGFMFSRVYLLRLPFFPALICYGLMLSSVNLLRGLMFSRVNLLRGLMFSRVNLLRGLMFSRVYLLRVSCFAAFIAPRAPESIFYFSCRDGVYECAVPIYSGGSREALCRIDETNNMASGEPISRQCFSSFTIKRHLHGIQNLTK